MCSGEQLLSSMLGRHIPQGFSCQASEAQSKAYFSLENLGRLTTEVTNIDAPVKNQCTTLIFSALIYRAAAKRQNHSIIFYLYSYSLSSPSSHTSLVLKYLCVGGKKHHNLSNDQRYCLIQCW